jgi:UrcA family protein
MRIRLTRPFGRILISTVPGALALAFGALPASAQGYDDDAGYYRGRPANEEVQIIGRRPPQERSSIGAPIEYVSVSREVRYDDLDLRTHWGAHVLRARIVRGAQEACRELDRRYPETSYPMTEGSPPCVRSAVEGAMDQADNAIAEARGYGRRY